MTDEFPDLPEMPPETPITHRRRELGLTKLAAARRAGLSRATWSAIEAGEETDALLVATAWSVLGGG